VRDTPEMNRGAGQGTPNSIVNLQPLTTIPAEEISQEVVVYLQRRFGLLPATAVVVAELAGYPR
jgi:hypothetical protein